MFGVLVGSDFVRILIGVFYRVVYEIIVICCIYHIYENENLGVSMGNQI